MRLLISAIVALTTAATVMGQDQDSRPQSSAGFADWRLCSGADINMTGEELSRPGVDVSSWYHTAVPKTVLAALVDKDVYPDPYFGLNMKSIPGYQDGLWLVQREDSPFRNSWWYRVEFDLPEEDGEWYYTLHFEGINYAANIWLNGKQIAGQDQVIGMFRRFEFPVTGLLVHGSQNRNALAVEIIPPGLLEGNVPHTKQVEATTGWDDHNPQPPDMNMGLWQPVYVHREGPVGIRHPYVESDLDLPGLEQARLTVSAWLHNNTDKPVECILSGTIEERAFSQPVTLAPNETREVFFRPESFASLVIDAPRVWWPHPTGKQELYQLELKADINDVLSNKVQTSFGIRDISTYINEDDWRGYRVNGRNILIRGGAWMTNDMLLNLEDSRYEALVRYAREANLNMLRSEGFSIRETGTFYDLCDRYGIMATQQIFGRNLPDEALAIACIEDTLLRIRNHPSLAHLLGHDETFPTKTLDKAYRDLIEKHRIRRSYQPHSGTFTIGTRAKTGGTRTGTRELWTYAGPTHYFWTKQRKFDSAWGFAQSGGIGGILAARDSIRQMMPETALWPVENNETWSFHTVLQGATYFDAVFKALERGYGKAEDFDDFCDKLYAMNYNSARGMFEAYARHKYDARGITTWKYNAAWPAALTWQYVDWYKRATAAYYGAKKACTPLHALYAHDDKGLYIVNSYYEPRAGLSLCHAVYGLDGHKYVEDTRPVSVDADGRTRVASFEAPEAAGDPYFLRLELHDGNGALLSDNTYWLSRTPDIPGKSGDSKEGVFYTDPKSAADFTALNALPETTLDATPSWEKGVLSLELRNPSPHIAFLAELALTDPETGRELAPVYWSENFVTLLPGEIRTIMAEAVGTDAAPALRMRGFNIRESLVRLEN
ncbi:MAG: hypothetical protein GXY07_16120 [Candidatus Hydrogenedentes bacterium]|nr:hypothetical protein [Candidatus Hydrogenedentota bacterium]